jgi:hypothetical protein
MQRSGAGARDVAKLQRQDAKTQREEIEKRAGGADSSNTSSLHRHGDVSCIFCYLLFLASSRLRVFAFPLFFAQPLGLCVFAVMLRHNELDEMSSSPRTSSPALSPAREHDVTSRRIAGDITSAKRDITSAKRDITSTTCDITSVQRHHQPAYSRRRHQREARHHQRAATSPAKQSHARSAARTFSGVNGTLRSRTPIAS